MGINIYPLIIICKSRCAFSITLEGTLFNDLAGFPGCILFSSSKSENLYNLKCLKRNELPIYYVCSLPVSAPDGFYKIPYDDLTDVQFLDIYVNSVNSTWFIVKPDELKQLSYLDTLHINTSHQWIHNVQSPRSDFRDAVFTVPSLKILRVTHYRWNNVTGNASWALTNNLKHLFVENSARAFFNLTTSDYLESLSLINCSLKNIPENEGLYYLKKLDLRNNILENMTAFDIASFCSLEYLNIADAKIDSCKCRSFQRLFNNMKDHPFHQKFIVKFHCIRRPQLNFTKSPKKCPKIDWDAVSKKRILCLQTVSSNVIRNVVFIVLGVAVVISVIVGVGVFILRFPV